MCKVYKYSTEYSLLCTKSYPHMIYIPLYILHNSFHKRPILHKTGLKSSYRAIFTPKIFVGLGILRINSPQIFFFGHFSTIKCFFYCHLVLSIPNQYTCSMSDNISNCIYNSCGIYSVRVRVYYICVHIFAEIFSYT